ncbi:MAG: AraC family transcriptional regulator [Rhizobiales bacterium]|nr:AraC family transcriptional regulator [Hyphomicrobiales bacterium]MBA67680.1 AraC family transcriptional regulator [Hyphomicrobiales bacterium]|tara:strand:- start:185 stop:1066 length:882 start_codon:yes stop_codon:yes gene_type:complete
MNKQSIQKERLLELTGPFAARQPGTHCLDTPLPRLKVWSSTQPTPPTPILFQPMFYAVLRGTKVLTLGANRFELSAGECAATSFGLPFSGQLENASLASPYVALSLDLDVELLVEAMLNMPKAEDRWVCSAAAGRLEGSVGDAFIRLASLLAAPDDRAMLGRAYEYELYYRLLQSPMGDTLRQLGQRDSRSRRIKTAADWLCSNVDKPLVISELAARVGMSLTSFHRHFKAVTGYSPLAFQRRMRLIEARQLLFAGGLTVSRIAYMVGYVSPSQFSREYKTMFGIPPAADLAR